MNSSRRIGRDRSFIFVGIGPAGIGIPRWLPLVLLYFATIFGLAWEAHPAWPPAADWVAALGPGVIGLFDLAGRLRTTHYEWVNPAGLALVARASLLDRLTFRECGWYLPVVIVPLPLWLLGAGLSLAFGRSWGLF